MSMYSYSQLYGLQAGTLRQAGLMAIFERVIDKLVADVGSIALTWGNNTEIVDLTEKYTVEYPDTITRPPAIAISLVSEYVREPGIGRIMVDGDESLTGFEKMVHFNVDIWARNTLERMLIADAITHCLAQKATTDQFRQYGIREFKQIGNQARNYEQESSALYQRMTVQQGSRIFRQLLQYQTEYDLVNVANLNAEYIEQILIRGNVNITLGVSAPIEINLGGLTELILDAELIPEAFEDVEITW